MARRAEAVGPAQQLAPELALSPQTRRARCTRAVCLGGHPGRVDELVHAAWAQRGPHSIHQRHAGVDVADQLRLALAGVGAVLQQDDLRLLRGTGMLSASAPTRWSHHSPVLPEAHCQRECSGAAASAWGTKQAERTIMVAQGPVARCRGPSYQSIARWARCGINCRLQADPGASSRPERSAASSRSAQALQLALVHPTGQPAPISRRPVGGNLCRAKGAGPALLRQQFGPTLITRGHHRPPQPLRIAAAAGWSVLLAGSGGSDCRKGGSDRQEGCRRSLSLAARCT